MTSWKRRIGKYLWKFFLRIKSAPINSWIWQSSIWKPSEVDDNASDFYPYRSVGRPRLKWDSAVRKFCELHHNESWQNLSIDVSSHSTDAFEQYCHNYEHDDVGAL